MQDEELQRQIRELEASNQRLCQQVASQNNRISELKTRATKVTRETEVEEEHIANDLFRRLDTTRHRNHQLRGLLDEEEVAAKGLLVKIYSVRQARAELENSLENEQESQMHQLQKNLLELASEKALLETQLHEERAAYLEHLDSRIAKLESKGLITAPLGHEVEGKRGAGAGAHDDLETSSQSSGTVASLKLELEAMLKAASEQHPNSPGTVKALTTRLRELQKESAAAKSRIDKLREQMDKAQTDLAFETELQARLKPSGGDDDAEHSFASMDQDSVRTQSSDSGSDHHRRAGEREHLRAHTHRLLSSATPNPLIVARPRRTPPSTPPGTTRSASMSSQGTGTASRR